MSNKSFFKIVMLIILMFCIFSIPIYANENNDLYNYSDERIIITLSNEKSRELKDYTYIDFPELSINKVIDLTEISKETLKNRKNNETPDGISLNRYNQTLCLYLNDKGYDNVKNAIEIISKRNDVIAVSPDYFAEPFSVVPNDPGVSEQWAIDNISLDDAWEITKGSSSSPVTVGVIDSGIQYNHPDLVSNLDTTKSMNFTNGQSVLDPTPTDTVNHGTCVASVIGAKGNNNIGIAGTAWNLKLISLKVDDYNLEIYNSQAVSSVISAIDYAIANNIMLLNYSSGWKHDASIPEPLLNPLEVIISNYPGLFVVAAGNSNDDLGDIKVYPACFHLNNMITVGASNQNNEVCYFSNFGESDVDLFAPGMGILVAKNNGSYENRNGTSFAAPYVTGVAALIKSIRPEFLGPKLKEIIMNNVDTVSSLSNMCVSGGKLNAYKALRAATEQQTFISDVNGDGYNDVIMSGKNSNNKRVLTTLLGNSNGGFTNEQTFTSNRTFFYIDSAFCGDFNGDGRSDILIHWINNSYRQLLIYLGKSNGSFEEAVNLSSCRYHNTYDYPVKFLVMDVNNDSKDDFVVVYKNTNGKMHFLTYKGKNTSPYIEDATTDALLSNYDYFDDSEIFSGDFNGDGYDDVLVPSYDSNEKRTLNVFRGTSSGAFNEGQLLTSVRNHKPYLYPYKYLVGDVSGDGKTDFVDVFNTNNFRDILTYKGTNISPYLIDSINDSIVYQEEITQKETYFLGDINGDGYDDLIVHYKNSNGKRCMRVHGGDSNGEFSSSIRTITTNNHNEITYPCSIYISDINNDGKNDMIVKWKDGNNCRLYVYKGKIDYTFNPAVSTSTNASFYLG